MRLLTWLGIALLVGGLVFLVYPAVSYTTTEEVLDIGPLEVERETTERVPIPPLAAGAAVAAGLVLVVVGRRR